MLRILKGKLKQKKKWICSIIGRDVTQPDIYEIQNYKIVYKRQDTPVWNKKYPRTQNLIEIFVYACVTEMQISIPQ